MISGVLLDLDGTLLDSIRPMEALFVDVIESLGTKITETERNNVAENLQNILIRRSSFIAGAKFLWSLGKYIGVSPYKRLIIMFLSYKRLKEIANGSPMFPGVLEVLSGLRSKGIKIGLVTTRSQKETYYLLQKHSMDDCFDTVVSRDDVEFGKPSPDSVLLAIKRLGMRSDETVMIGDMPTDIMAGKSAGTKTIGLLVGIFNKKLEELKPDALANSIQELPVIIDRL